MDMLTESNCPDELLSEILDCGVFGNATQAQKTAVQMKMCIRDRCKCQQMIMR